MVDENRCPVASDVYLFHAGVVTKKNSECGRAMALRPNGGAKSGGWNFFAEGRWVKETKPNNGYLPELLQ